MTGKNQITAIAQCPAIGRAAVVVCDERLPDTARSYTVCARKGRRGAELTWIMGPTRRSEREAILAWNSWMAKIRFGEWSPA